MANTQRPPPPALDAPAEADELGELSESLDAGAARREPVSDIEGLRPELVTVGRPSARGIPRGSEHERLDLSALSKEAYAAPPVPRLETPELESPLPVAPRVSFDDEPYVLPQKRKPWGALLLLLGFGAGVAVSAVMFAASNGRGADASHATGAVSSAATPAAAAPAATEQEPAPVQGPAPAATAAPFRAPVVPAATMVGTAPSAAPTHAAAQPAEVTARGVARSQPGAMTSPAAPPRAPAFASPGESPAAPPAPAAPSTPVLVLRRAAEPEPAAEPASGKRGSLDTLLDDALSPEARAAELAREQQPPPQPQSAPPPLSQTPSRSEVTQAMNGLQRAIMGCAMGQTGVAQAVLTVRNDGTVVTAEITNAPFAGTASGRCMEGALRSAHFPRFTKPLFSVRYPFSIE